MFMNLKKMAVKNARNLENIDVVQVCKLKVNYLGKMIKYSKRFYIAAGYKHATCIIYVFVVLCISIRGD